MSEHPAGFGGVAAPLLTLPKKTQPLGMNPTIFVSFHNTGSHNFTVRHVTVQAMTAMISHFVIAMATVS